VGIERRLAASRNVQRMEPIDDSHHVAVPKEARAGIPPDVIAPRHAEASRKRRAWSEAMRSYLRQQIAEAGSPEERAAAVRLARHLAQA